MARIPYRPAHIATQGPFRESVYTELPPQLRPEDTVTKMLSSWKEIAHFFEKGVRTVQRWEKTLDLPIRRPPGAPSNVVLARTSDLEEWMHRSAAARDAVASREQGADELQIVISELEVEVRKLAGTTPQPMEATEVSSREPAERLRELVAAVRTLQANAEAASLRRVA